MLKAWGPLTRNRTQQYSTLAKGLASPLFNVTVVTIQALGTCCGTVPTSRWAIIPPSSTFPAAYLTKVGKNGTRSRSPHSAIHEIPHRSSGIEMGSESWKMEMQWHFHAFLLFRRGWMEDFCNLDKRVSMFTLLSSQGNIFLCWCLLLISLWESRLRVLLRAAAAEEGFYSPEDGSASPGVWKAPTVTASSCTRISYLMKLNETPCHRALLERNSREVIDVMIPRCFYYARLPSERLQITVPFLCLSVRFNHTV